MHLTAANTPPSITAVSGNFTLFITADIPGEAQFRAEDNNTGDSVSIFTCSVSYNNTGDGVSIFTCSVSLVQK